MGGLCSKSDGVTGGGGEATRPGVHSNVFFEVAIDGDNVGIITMELYDNTPKTSENFRSLCVGFTKQSNGKTLTYKNSTFHRVIRGFMAQGGDFTNHNGTGGESIYGKDFEDENFINQHTGRGILSMANAGPNTNGSQFFMCFKTTSNLNRKHCVFGKITDGFDVLTAIERNPCGAQNKPVKPVVIVDCGQL